LQVVAVVELTVLPQAVVVAVRVGTGHQLLANHLAVVLVLKR
jgi:hypothetical protein